jgi:quercetin dioxygenase-like cupin family protein
MSSIFDMQDACRATMTIYRAGQGLAQAPAGVSSAPFQVQMLLSSRREGEMTAMRVFAPPGVVTHWHSHPRGQLLFVLDGVGFVQREGDGPVQVSAGDAIWFAPDERHWHGAAASIPFSYLSVQPVKDGTAVQWFGPVEHEDLQS